MTTSYHSAKFQDDGMIVDFEAVISEDQRGAGLFRIKRVFRGELITDISSSNALVFGEWMRDYVGYGRPAISSPRRACPNGARSGSAASRGDRLKSP